MVLCSNSFFFLEKVTIQNCAERKSVVEEEKVKD